MADYNRFAYLLRYHVLETIITKFLRFWEELTKIVDRRMLYCSMGVVENRILFCTSNDMEKRENRKHQKIGEYESSRVFRSCGFESVMGVTEEDAGR